MEEKYEVEECECGHIAPTQFIVRDEEGNGTCMKCHIGFLQEVYYHEMINEIFYFFDQRGLSLFKDEIKKVVNNYISKTKEKTSEEKEYPQQQGTRDWG